MRLPLYVFIGEGFLKFFESSFFCNFRNWTLKLNWIWVNQNLLLFLMNSRSNKFSANLLVLSEDFTTSTTHKFLVFWANVWTVKDRTTRYIFLCCFYFVFNWNNFNFTNFNLIKNIIFSLLSSNVEQHINRRTIKTRTSFMVFEEILRTVHRKKREWTGENFLKQVFFDTKRSKRLALELDDTTLSKKISVLNCKGHKNFVS